MDKYWIVQTLEDVEEKKKRKVIKIQKWIDGKIWYATEFQAKEAAKKITKQTNKETKIKACDFYK